jgi:hypothetical protein
MHRKKKLHLLLDVRLEHAHVLGERGAHLVDGPAARQTHAFHPSRAFRRFEEKKSLFLNPLNHSVKKYKTRPYTPLELQRKKKFVVRNKKK